jgi:hypothetical protein
MLGSEVIQKKKYTIAKYVVLGIVMSLTLFSSTSSVSAYPTYSPNTDLVRVGPYDTAASGTANWSCGLGCSSGGYREFITLGQKYRIRQAGTISRVRIYTGSVTSLTGLYIKVWRKDGSTYDLVGTSENIKNSL